MKAHFYVDLSCTVVRLAKKLTKFQLILASHASKCVLAKTRHKKEFTPFCVSAFMPWSSLVKGADGLYWQNCKTNLVIINLLIWHFMTATAYHLGHKSLKLPQLKSSAFEQISLLP